jgi:hypothetical protein
MAGIHVLNSAANKDVDGRNKSGHDGLSVQSQLIGDQLEPAAAGVNFSATPFMQ